MRRTPGKHSTCRVQFEDYAGHLHNVTVRVPRKAPLTARVLTRLAAAKARHKAARLVGMTCSDSGRVPLPYRRRR